MKKAPFKTWQRNDQCSLIDKVGWVGLACGLVCNQLISQKKDAMVVGWLGWLGCQMVGYMKYCMWVKLINFCLESG